MAEPLRNLSAVLVLLALYTAPLAAGLWLEIGWLTQLGFIVVFGFVLYGYKWEWLGRRRPVQEHMLQILEEQNEKGID